ncbi:hypothetical protein MN608_06722 [Microdochium nivale]|nr:hypothetical protein MN608_06722 [Microdochium nivale]
MDMNQELVMAAWRSSFILQQDRIRLLLAEAIRPTPWLESFLNHQNRPGSLDNSCSRWRVDGAMGCATRFFAVPLGLAVHRVPLRIFLFLSDQADHPPALRTCLDTAVSLPLRNASATTNLGIARHLCRVMNDLCARDLAFLDW